jgi:raffinose/stachyose/melibiose transport system permease protein
VFFDYDGYKAYYVGLDNFTRLFTRDTTYWGSVLHTFEYATLKLVFILPVALISAVLLSKALKGTNFFRILFFTPTVISSVIYGLIFYFIYSPYNGTLNYLLMNIGLGHTMIDWLGDPKTAMLSIVMVAVWGGFGNYMILLVAGLQSIPQELYESSKMDGANSVQNFFYVTLPMLGPILKVVLMLAITSALKDYEVIMVMTGGGPQERTDVMFLYIYYLLFGNPKSLAVRYQIGYGATAGLVSAVIIGMITVAYLRVSRKLDDIY